MRLLCELALEPFESRGRRVECIMHLRAWDVLGVLCKYLGVWAFILTRVRVHVAITVSP